MDSSKKIFRKVRVSYFSVLVIPIIAGVFIYYSALSSVTELFKDDVSNMLKSSISTSDERFMEAEHIPSYLKADSNLHAFLQYSEIKMGSKDIYSVYQAYSNMTNFGFLNSVVADVQIVSLLNDFVIGHNSALRLDRQTYPVLFDFKEMNCDAFLRLLQENYFFNSFKLLHDRDGRTVPALFFSFSYDDSAPSLAVVIIRLRESYLQDILSKMLTDQDGIAFILDQNNNLVTSAAGNQCSVPLKDAVSYVQNHSSGTNYQNYIVNILKSDYNGWKYCIFSPYRIITQRMSTTNMFLSVFTIITLVLSACFTYFLVHKKAESLKLVIRYLNGDGEYPSPYTKKDEFSYIADSAVKLVSSNETLKNRLEVQKPLLEAATLRNLLNGVSYKAEELRFLFQYLDIQPSHQLFAVMTLNATLPGLENSLDYEKYPLLISAMMQELIEKHTLLPVYPVDMDRSHKALIFIGTDLGKENFIKKIQFFAEHLVLDASTENGLHITCYLSDVFDLVDSIPTAYRQTVIISRQAVIQEGCYLYRNEDIPPIHRFYYYPLQTEQEFLKLIRHGTKTELRDMIDRIQKANFIERSLSASTVTQLIFSISNSILRDLNTLSSDELPLDLMNDIENAGNFDELVDAVLMLNQFFVQVNTQLQPLKMEKQIHEIMQFINDHYTDQDFSILCICEAFHISESTAYKIFRQAIDTSFADLVEHMRIERACQMLNEKQFLIKDISSAVGYTNDNSFRRAFKRVMGMTPREYSEFYTPPKSPR